MAKRHLQQRRSDSLIPVDVQNPQRRDHSSWRCWPRRYRGWSCRWWNFRRHHGWFLNRGLWFLLNWLADFSFWLFFLFSFCLHRLLQVFSSPNNRIKYRNSHFFVGEEIRKLVALILQLAQFGILDLRPLLSPRFLQINP